MMIPVLGQIFAQDWKSYQYLVESIRQFPKKVCERGVYDFAIDWFLLFKETSKIVDSLLFPTDTIDLYFDRFGGLMGRLSASEPRSLVQSLTEVIPKTLTV